MGALKITDAYGKNRYFDIVIDASNLDNKAYGITGIDFEKIQPTEMAVTGLGKSMVGKKLTGAEVYLAGPAGNVQLTGKELQTFPRAIRENTVAIWANAPPCEPIGTGDSSNDHASTLTRISYEVKSAPF